MSKTKHNCEFYHSKIYKLSKTNIFFSRFEATRGEKTQIFHSPRQIYSSSSFRKHDWEVQDINCQGVPFTTIPGKLDIFLSIFFLIQKSSGLYLSIKSKFWLFS